MVGADAPVLHLIDGVVAPPSAQPPRKGQETAVVLAMRAARPLLDRLDRADRARIGAAVVSHPDPDPRRVRDTAECVCAGLPIAAALPLPICGLDGGGVFAALHVARAALLGEAEMALLVSFSGWAVAAILLGRSGAVACRPLPPARGVSLNDGEAAVARSRGAALARMVERGGVRRRAIRRAASPGLPRVEAAGALREAGLSHVLTHVRGGELAGAASVEQALVLAATGAGPLPPTLLWTCGEGGDVSACVLEGA